MGELEKGVGLGDAFWPGVFCFLFSASFVVP